MTLLLLLGTLFAVADDLAVGIGRQV